MNGSVAVLRTHWIIRLIGILYVALGLLFIAPIMAQRLYICFPFVLLLLGGGVFLLMESRSYIQVDADAVKVKVTRGTFRIPWAEVTTIRVRGSVYAFEGNDKRLVVTFLLAGSGKGDVISLIRKIAEQRAISVVENAKPPLTQWNTRVR
jgi:hypothetical protein